MIQIFLMFQRDWGELTYREQIGYLSNLVHVVASEMENSYGANNEHEILGAAASVLEEIPNRTISRFYKSVPYVLEEQMRLAMDHLKTCGHLSKIHDGEFLCVAPQMPEMEVFVRDVFDAYAKSLKSYSRDLYAGVVQKEYDVLPNPIGLDFGQTRFNR